MARRGRGGARDEEEFLRALQKTVPDTVEQSPESVDRTRAALREQLDAAGENAAAVKTTVRGVTPRRAAIALGALALIALVVVLAFQPWRRDGSKKPPVSGDRGARSVFTLGPADYEIDVKTSTKALTEPRAGSFDLLESVTVEVDATDTGPGERVQTECVVDMKPGATAGSAPYELRFDEYPYVLAGDVEVVLGGGGGEAHVYFKGAARSGGGAVFYGYDEFIEFIDLD